MNINGPNDKRSILTDNVHINDQSKPVPVKHIDHKKEISTSSGSNANHQKPILSRCPTNQKVEPQSITSAQKQIHNLTLQQSQVYSGMNLLHPLLTGHQGLSHVNGLFYQQPNGLPIIIAPGGTNLPAPLLQSFNALQNNLINNQLQVMNVLYQQMAQLQLQVQDMIQKMAGMAVQAQLPPAQFRYLLPQPVMQPQPVALGPLIGYVNQPKTVLSDPWLPQTWAIQPNSRIINGFPAQHSHWVAGNAPLPAAPTQPGFYFQPQPPAPNMMFQNPMLPHTMWMNHVNKGLDQQAHNFYNHMQYPIIYPGISSIQPQTVNPHPHAHLLLQGKRPDHQSSDLQKQLSALNQKLTVFLQENPNDHNETALKLKDEINKFSKYLCGKSPSPSLTMVLNKLKQKYSAIVKESKELHLQKAQLEQEIEEIEEMFTALTTEQNKHKISEEKIVELESTLNNITTKNQHILQGNEDLNKKIIALKKALEQLSQTNNSLNTQEEEKENELREESTQLLHLKQELQSFRDKQEQYLSEITGLEESNRNLLQAMEDTKKDNESRMLELLENIKTLGINNEEITRKKNVLNDEIQCAKEELESVINSLDEAKQENKKINNEVTALENEYEQIQQATTGQTEHIEELNISIEELTSNQEESDKKIHELKEERSLLQVMQSELAAKLAILEGIEVEMEERTKELKEEISVVTDAVRAEQKTLIGDLESELSSEKKINEEFKSLQKTLSAQAAEIQGRLDLQKENNGSLTQDIDSQNNTISDLKSKNISLEQELSTSNELKGTQDAQIEGNEREINAIKSSLEKMQGINSKLHENETANADELLKLNNHLEESKKKSEELNRLLDEAKLSLETTKKELEATKLSVDSSNDELKDSFVELTRQVEVDKKKIGVMQAIIERQEQKEKEIEQAIKGKEEKSEELNLKLGSSEEKIAGLEIEKGLLLSSLEKSERKLKEEQEKTELFNGKEKEFEDGVQYKGIVSRVMDLIKEHNTSNTQSRLALVGGIKSESDFFGKPGLISKLEEINSLIESMEGIARAKDLRITDLTKLFDETEKKRKDMEHHLASNLPAIDMTIESFLDVSTINRCSGVLSSMKSGDKKTDEGIQNSVQLVVSAFYDMQSQHNEFLDSQNTPSEVKLPQKLQEETVIDIENTIDNYNAHKTHLDALTKLKEGLGESINAMQLDCFGKDNNDNDNEFISAAKGFTSLAMKKLDYVISSIEKNTNIYKGKVNLLTTTVSSQEVLDSKYKEEITAEGMKKFIDTVLSPISSSYDKQKTEDQLARSFHITETSRQLLEGIVSQSDGLDCSKMVSKNLHEYQIKVEALKQCAVKLRPENLGIMGAQLPEQFKKQQNNYVDFTLKQIEEDITKNTTTQKVSPEYILESQFKSDTKLGNTYKVVKGKINKEELESTREILKDRELLTDIIWMVSRQKDTTANIDKGKTKIYCSTNEGDDNDELYYKYSERTLTNICSSHGLTVKLSMPAVLLVLSNLTWDINSPVLSILNERHTAQAGLTKSSDKTRAEKFSSLCLKLMAKEKEIAENKKLFHRGHPQNVDGDIVESPHKDELQLFDKNTDTYYHVNVTAKDDVNKTSTGKITSDGLLGSYFRQTGSTEYKEMTATGEVTIIDSASSPKLIFKQQSKKSKLSVEIAGSNKVCDQKLYLTFPNYSSPFKNTQLSGELHRNSLPLSDTMTSEVGELVLVNDKHFYFKVIENFDSSGGIPILKCEAIGPESNAAQEILEGCIFAYSGCMKKGLTSQADYLLTQAFTSFKTLDSSVGKEEKAHEQELDSFITYIKDHFKSLQKYDCSWLQDIETGNIKKKLSALPVLPASLVGALYSGAKVIAPDSVLIIKNREARVHRGTEVISEPLDTQRLPVDFEDQQDVYFKAMTEKLRVNDATEYMIKKRKKEIAEFRKSVFPSRRCFKGTNIKNVHMNSRSIDIQIEKMKQHIQFQKEEYMGYLEDCSRLEVALSQKLPENMKHCNAVDAKNLTGSGYVSETCSLTIMALMVAETGANSSQVLIGNMEKLLDEMKQLSIDSMQLTDSEFKHKANIINATNSSVSCEHYTLHARLKDTSSEKLAPKDISVRMFESTQKSTLRDYQIETTKTLSDKIHRMSTNNEEPSRTYCQFGTGYGKTLSCQFFLKQGCQSNMGSIYIAPEENVNNFDRDMSRYARRQNSHYNRINIKQLYKEDDRWYEKTSTLNKIYKMVCGEPQTSNGAEKTPTSMSTTDLQALMQLRVTLSADQTTENFKLVDDIIAILTGGSLKAVPLIIRDECDSIGNIDAVTADVNMLLGGTVESGDVMANQIQYDAALRRVIFMSASINTDFGLLQFTDETSLENISQNNDTVNKSVNTCEQRSERYALDSDWKLISSDENTAKSNIEAAVKQAISTYDNNKDLIFCYPNYAEVDNASEKLAEDGIKAFENATHTKDITGHLYFKDGDLYRYTKNHPVYGSNEDNLGCKLSHADQDDIYKNGGKGFITWMTEVRGYTAAQHKNTAFVFCSLFNKSSATVQQTIGRDRNNDPFRSYDGSIIITKNDITGWQCESTSKTQKKIKKDAVAAWNKMEAKKKDLNANNPHASVNKAMEHKIIISLDDRTQQASIDDTFSTKLRSQAEVWNKDSNIKPHIKQLIEYKEAEWRAIQLCKQAFMCSRVNHDFSDETIKFEHASLRGKKKAEAQNLLRYEKQQVNKVAKDSKQVILKAMKVAVPDASKPTPQSSSSRPLSTNGKHYGSMSQLDTMTEPKETQVPSNKLAASLATVVHNELLSMTDKTHQVECKDTQGDDINTTSVSNYYKGSSMKSQIEAGLTGISKRIEDGSIEIPSSNSPTLKSYQLATVVFKDKAKLELKNLTSNLGEIINTLQAGESEGVKRAGKKLLVIQRHDNNEAVVAMNNEVMKSMTELRVEIEEYMQACKFDDFSNKLRLYIINILKNLEKLAFAKAQPSSGLGYLLKALDNITATRSTKESEMLGVAPHPRANTTQAGEINMMSQSSTQIGFLIKIVGRVGDAHLKFCCSSDGSAIEKLASRAVKEIGSPTKLGLDQHKSAVTAYKVTLAADKKIKSSIVEFVQSTLTEHMKGKCDGINRTITSRAEKKDQKIEKQIEYMIQPPSSS